MSEKRDNNGALFKNDKGGNDKRPDYRGPAIVAGKEYEIAAWLKKSAKGQPYMSLSFSEPRPKGGTKVAGDDDAPPPKKGADFDDALPF